MSRLISISFSQELLPVSLTPEAATGQFRATKEKDYYNKSTQNRMLLMKRCLESSSIASDRTRDWRPAVPEAQVLTSQPQEEEKEIEGRVDHQSMLYSHSQNNFHPHAPQPKSRGLEKWVSSLRFVLARFCHLNTR